MRPKADVEATVARGGGLSGLTETIHVWSIGAAATAELRRSDSRRSRAVHLSNATLSNILGELDSLAGSIPARADTGDVKLLCGDAVTTHLTVRRNREVRVAYELARAVVPRSTPIGREWTVYLVYSRTPHDKISTVSPTNAEAVKGAIELFAAAPQTLI